MAIRGFGETGIPALDRAIKASEKADAKFYGRKTFTPGTEVHGIVCHDEEAANFAAAVARGFAKMNGRRDKPPVPVDPLVFQRGKKSQDELDRLTRQIDREREAKELQALDGAIDEWLDPNLGAW